MDNFETRAQRIFKKNGKDSCYCCDTSSKANIHSPKDLIWDRPIYMSLMILSAHISLLQMYQYVCSPICADIKIVFKARKNARMGDLKCCNYIVCPAEGTLIL